MKSLVFIFFICPIIGFGQDMMVGNNAATQTIDGTIDEMLRIVNGEKGKERHWEVFKNLFLPTARFTVVNPEDYSLETADISEMVGFMQDDYYGSGYSERIIHRTKEEFNGIAHVFEVVLHTEPDGNKAKGLNSYQLVYSNQRWWIANIIWTFETENSKIPENYLKH